MQSEIGLSLSNEILLGNKRLLPLDELNDFLNAKAELMRDLGVVATLAHEGETYVHTSQDMQDDGRARTITRVVPEGYVYVNFVHGQ